jgi:hypothetical protein
MESATLIRPQIIQVSQAHEKSHIPSDFVVEHFWGSLKASRGEDLQIEEPVYGGDASTFHFHAALTGMPSPTLIWHQVVEVRQPSQKGLLVPLGMMKGFHHE